MQRGDIHGFAMACFILFAIRVLLQVAFFLYLRWRHGPLKRPEGSDIPDLDDEEAFHQVCETSTSTRSDRLDLVRGD